MVLRTCVGVAACGTGGGAGAGGDDRRKASRASRNWPLSSSTTFCNQTTSMVLVTRSV